MIAPLDLVSGRTAAKLLGVSPATIGNRVQRGDLTPYARLENGTYLFRREDLVPTGTPIDLTDHKGCSECGALTLAGADFCPAHTPQPAAPSAA